MNMESPKNDNEPVVIKKYANRRLYDTETSSYITLEDLCQRVKDGREFIVLDAKSGQDLTRQILTQIIFEQETKGYPLLPTDFLRDVIRFYDDNMHNTLQHYLEASMKTFMQNQEKMRGMIMSGRTRSMASPFGPLEEMARQNMALFEQAFQMFSPASYFSSDKNDSSDEKK